jgi:antibiotic biosynthesis monooxygenase (ABM) superfamily enzyme
MLPTNSTESEAGSTPRICRIWRGWTTPENAAAYEAIVRDEVIPEIEGRRIPGFLSIDLMRRHVEVGVEFATIMWFDDLESVKAFVGEDYEVAHVPDRARAVLSRFDERSAHYEAIDHRDQARESG